MKAEFLQVKSFLGKHDFVTGMLIVAIGVGIPWLILVPYRDAILWWTGTAYAVLFGAVFIGGIIVLCFHALMRWRFGKIPKICDDTNRICVHFKISFFIVGVILAVTILLANPLKW